MGGQEVSWTVNFQDTLYWRNIIQIFVKRAPKKHLVLQCTCKWEKEKKLKRIEKILKEPINHELLMIHIFCSFTDKTLKAHLNKIIL